MRRSLRWAVFALCLSAPAQQAQTAPSQIPVLTRLVQFYADAEQRLAEAINRDDKVEIDRLVADDFELRSAAAIGVPVPRADWLAQSLKDAPVSISVGQMAVHEFGDVRVVSFLMTRAAAGGGEASFALVDVWVQSGQSSVLKVRYAAPRGAASELVPGEVRQPQIEKRF